MTLDQLLFRPESIVVLALCLIIGFGIKRSPIASWIIVWIVPAAGAAIYYAWEGQGAYLAYGALLGGIAIYGHQLITQSKTGIAQFKDGDLSGETKDGLTSNFRKPPGPIPPPPPAPPPPPKP